MIKSNTTGFMARFLLFVMLFSMLIGCQDKNQYNVMIVTFDTTRADHIATYGKTTARTPILDQLANDGVVYEKSLAPIAITLPSHSTIMTGQVPFVHGVRDNGLFKLSENKITLAEILKSKGYKTSAAIGSFPLTSQFGINQGFDYFNEHITQKYEDIFGEKTIAKDKLFFDERKAAQVNEAIMPWIENQVIKKQGPFFTWLHYFDPHHPHEPPSPYNQIFVNDLYQGEIAYSDESLGNVIAQLKRLNVYDNTLIIFTSDHGEGLEEHNESTHSMLIYNSTLHVPLIIKYPQQKHAGTRISQWVGLVDIFPTVLNTLGINIPDDIQGEVLPINNIQDSSSEYYMETLSPRFSRGWGEQRGLLKNGFKYIYGPQKELYNLRQDHHEINNIISENQQLAQTMESDLRNYIDEYQPEVGNSSIDVDADTLNTLRGLGYVQSSGQAIEYFDEKLDDSGDAPQRHIGTISSYSQAKNLLYKGNYIEANRFLDALLLTDPDNLAYLELKIQADLNLGNYQEAKTILEQLPDESYGALQANDRMLLLAKIYFLERNFKESKELLENAENLEMTWAGQNLLAQIFASESNLVRQQKHLKNLLEINPDAINVLNDLAISYIMDDNIYLAEQTFEKAIVNNPFHQLSYYNYGTFLYSINDFKAAEKNFLHAVELDNFYIKAHYALIELYVTQNQVDKAKTAFRTLKDFAPSNPLTKIAEKWIQKL
ncbi:MAG: sulfatase-like hydrolase/transferase [Marinicellaceae bacterium]